MGNCVFKGAKLEVDIQEEQEQETIIKVVTTNGGIMELHPPITSQYITQEFPGHAIYSHPNHNSPPLLDTDCLLPGHLYYLLPFTSIPITTTTAKPTAYRMSFDHERVAKKSNIVDYSNAPPMSAFQKGDRVIPRYINRSGGVWKVKLVISSSQLAEILAQDAKTEELIESVRTVAKCGSRSRSGFGGRGVLPSSSPSMVDSDQSSICSGNG